MPKNLLVSTLPLIISLVLFIIVGKYGVGRVLELRDSISQANTLKATLTEKLSTLRTQNANLASSSQISSIALPDKNPSIIVLSQMKALAGQNLLALTNAKTGSAGSSGSSVSSAGLVFDVAGPRQGIFSFLQGIKKVAPITLIDKIKYNEQGENGRATINVTSFWASFPTKIPAVDAPVTTLTADEQKVLNDIDTLVPPQFAQVTPSTGGKTDPFAQ